MTKKFFLSLFIVLLFFSCYSQSVVITDTVSLKDEITLKPDKYPRYIGGDAQWYEYVRKNLNPMIPINNNAPNGEYHVTARFIVNRDGIAGDIIPVTKCGYGMETELIRIIQAIPKWKPAIKNKIPVNAYLSISVAFVVDQ